MIEADRSVSVDRHTERQTFQYQPSDRHIVIEADRSVSVDRHTERQTFQYQPSDRHIVIEADRSVSADRHTERQTFQYQPSDRHIVIEADRSVSVAETANPPQHLLAVTLGAKFELIIFMLMTDLRDAACQALPSSLCPSLANTHDLN